MGFPIITTLRNRVLRTRQTAFPKTLTFRGKRSVNAR
jgi:hypothetical protein